MSHDEIEIWVQNYVGELKSRGWILLYQTTHHSEALYKTNLTTSSKYKFAHSEAL